MVEVATNDSMNGSEVVGHRMCPHIADDTMRFEDKWQKLMLNGYRYADFEFVNDDHVLNPSLFGCGGNFKDAMRNAFRHFRPVRQWFDHVEHNVRR